MCACIVVSFAFEIIKEEDVHEKHAVVKVDLLRMDVDSTASVSVSVSADDCDCKNEQGDTIIGRTSEVEQGLPSCEG